jgi:hypothetical protein
VNDDWRAGWALSGGFWVDDIRQTAVVWEYLQVGRHTFESNVGDLSVEPNFVSRPIFNVLNGQQGGVAVTGIFQTVTEPDANTTVTRTEVYRGTGQVRAYEDFYTAGIGLQHRFRELNNYCEEGHSGQMSWIVGYRHVHDDSFLGIKTRNTVILTDSTVVDDDPATEQTVVLVRNEQESFVASNNFHGVELGLNARVERWGWWLEGLSTFSIGANRRVVTLDGDTSVANATTGGTPDTAGGSLYVSDRTNLGRYSDTKATIIPRLRGGIGCQLTPRLSFRSGYSAIFWPDAVRAADHLSPGLVVDRRNLPFGDPTGATDNPRFPGIQGRTIVAHGFDLALELRY